jgi:predicted DNA repair protein MutK
MLQRAMVVARLRVVVLLDDVAVAVGKARTMAAGVVIDEAAVTPYVVGLSPARELPIIWKVAKGTLRNKLLYLLPAALALKAFAPWAITPLVMIGGIVVAAMHLVPRKKAH